jgi:hypothetical protein
MLTRLSGPDGTLANYLSRVSAGDEFPAFATDVGGPAVVTPGDSAEVLLPARPGRHLVISWHADDVLVGFRAEFVVQDGDVPSRVPGPALEVSLSDYSISPIEPHPGPGLLHVTNRGPKTHELIVVRLAPGKHPADYFAWRAAGEHGEMPGRPVGGTAALGPGGEIWAAVTWAPGEYLVYCAVETTGPHPIPRHYTLGMQQRITVR